MDLALIIALGGGVLLFGGYYKKKARLTCDLLVTYL